MMTWTTLVGRLMLEGDDVGAREVVDRDMPAAGVAPNRVTRRTLALPADRLGMMRTAKLKLWTKYGSAADIQAARDLVNTLEERGVCI